MDFLRFKAMSSLDGWLWVIVPFGGCQTDT
jgi:hypothetical protein